MLGLRLGKRPQTFISTTPKPIKLLKEIIKDPNTITTKGTTFDNEANLAPSFLSQIVSRYRGTRLGRQELNAEILEDVQGALWNRDLLEEGRRAKDAVPPMKRIVIAIDPATSVSETSDATGLVVCGRGVDDHGYILQDESGKYSPIEWARKAIALYHRWKADRIVAEANQGGEMVETTIRTIDASISYKAVHASRGKIARAEPISSLFEQHRVHLVGSFPELEDQLCSFAAGSQGSPDRLDAMVWGLTELMLETVSYTGFIDYFAELCGATQPASSRASADAWMATERRVRLLCPPGISHVKLWSASQEISVPADRVLEGVLESDAKPLLGAGFICLSNAVGDRT